MKILVVGAFGFIGKRFCEKSISTYDLILFGKENSFRNKKLKINTNKIEFGDITSNISQIIEKIKPDIVLHLSALTGLSKCNNNIKNAFHTNVIGTYNVIQGCLKVNAHLIFISSREVYGETKNESTNETDSLEPKNVYGVTKLIGEEMVINSQKKFGLKFTILRLTNVYGPGGDNYGAQIIIKNALNGFVNVLGGKQVMNFVYVDDVIDVINNVINNKKCLNEIFNVGSYDNLSINQFVEMVVKNIPKEVVITEKPTRKTETENFVPDLSKITQTLKFYPQTSINNRIKKIIQYYMNS